MLTPEHSSEIGRLLRENTGMKFRDILDGVKMSRILSLLLLSLLLLSILLSSFFYKLIYDHHNDRVVRSDTCFDSV